MIEKIESIEEFAVFKSFDWDSCVCDRDGTCLHFKKLNIIYGRNYSGKTTLSRIARALETGTVDDKFDSPNFTVRFTDGSVVDQSSPLSRSHKVRVFNEDFVREHFRFIVDPDEGVTAFAILGKENNKLEAEIQNLEDELGSDTEGEETGLYAKRRLSSANVQAALQSEERATKALGDVLAKKATKGPQSIRYQSDVFGDQNYNIAKLKNDIKAVLSVGFNPVDEDKQSELRRLLKEETRPDVIFRECPAIDIELLASEVRLVVTREISRSSKLENLLKDAALNRWASDGRRLHAADSTTCKFCENAITAERWRAIESHFDEESDKLEKDIEALAAKLIAARKTIDARERFDGSVFYAQFRHRIQEIEKEAGKAIRNCRSGLDALTKALEKRRQNLLTAQEPPECGDPASELARCHEQFESVRSEANNLSSTLSKDQQEARISLRLATVKEFADSIDYAKQVEKIRGLEQDRTNADTTHRSIVDAIASKRQLIAEKKRQLNDEEQGAIRVNDLLNAFFGNRHLSLQAIEDSDGEEVSHIRFEVVRNGTKAYHLSEGERSLLAFCYFMAKLEESDTTDAKPIVWIDDPISSLDGNHVFFVYSLIDEHLHRTLQCDQLFISTHSLDFLKYLRRLPGAIQDKNTKERKRKCRYLTVVRQEDASVLAPMPTYMQEYVTEFNFLFEQVYRCATAVQMDDSNFREFYSFGNNARKFLELYLYYAYPDESSDREKLTRFFGDQPVPAILVDRVNNEYSHMAGVFERGSAPVVQPEMQLCARMICDRLSQNPDQYRALLRSIGREGDLDPLESTAPILVE